MRISYGFCLILNRFEPRLAWIRNVDQRRGLKPPGCSEPGSCWHSKSVTHNVFSAGLCIFAVVFFGAFLPVSLLLAVWLSFSVNFVIDVLGHSKRARGPVRSWTTHSVFTAPLWGASPGVLTAAFVAGTLQLAPADDLLELSAVLGALAGLSHLFLDSLTEGGVFLWRRRRIALAHLGNGGVLLNATFSFLGILLVVAAGYGLLGPTSIIFR